MHLRMPRVVVGILVVTSTLVLFHCRSSKTPTAGSATGPWHDLEGLWTATGTRSAMMFTQARSISVATYSGTLFLSSPSRPSLGFRADAIVFNDTTTGLIGRATWTDNDGNIIYSELSGDATNVITGTVVGGTGRFAGAEGEYKFSWRFLIEDDDGTLKGESVGLTGRVRIGTNTADARESQQ